MIKKEKGLSVPDELVMKKIFFIRNHKVMPDSDLAELYVIDTKQLKRQVRRNIDRFPDDCMFELTKEEYDPLRSQFGTLNRGAHAKYLPYAFTEQGVAMLSSVLNSKQAIQINIGIMRVFTQVRQMLLDNTELRLAIEEIRKKTENNTKTLKWFFNTLMSSWKRKTMPSPVRRSGTSYQKRKNK